MTDSTGWRIAGAADFDKDGHPDILWHNGTTGEIQYWYMNGADGTTFRFSVQRVAGLNVPATTGWRIVAR